MLASTIVGTGLTAVDVILEAHALGFQGTYTVVSRHGRFPLPHENPSALANIDLPQGWETRGSVTQLLKLVRQQARAISTSQPVIDAMRPRIQAMWKNLSPKERLRFIRHVQPFWEIHRHRIPAEHARIIQQLRDENRLNLIAGRVSATRAEGGNHIVQVALRGKDRSPLTLQSDAALLCAGTDGHLASSSEPLIQNLIQQGLLKTGPLKLGALPPQETHALHGARTLWVVGPLQRETGWEITAVRELREEALTVAHDVIEALSDTGRENCPSSASARDF